MSIAKINFIAIPLVDFMQALKPETKLSGALVRLEEDGRREESIIPVKKFHRANVSYVCELMQKHEGKFTRIDLTEVI